eukprot:1507662-Rhodomonas_salina.1
MHTRYNNPPIVLADVRYWLSLYVPRRCLVLMEALCWYQEAERDCRGGGSGVPLRACYAMPGTDVAYGARRRRGSGAEWRVGSRYGATRFLCDVRY